MNDNGESGKTAELFLLPNAALSPELLLHALLKEIETIDTIVVTIRAKDGSMTVEHSNLNAGELALMNLMLDEYTRSRLFGSGGEDDVG